MKTSTQNRVSKFRPHSCFPFEQEAERNTKIKDTMRDSCITELVDSWYRILVSWLYIVILKHLLQTWGFQEPICLGNVLAGGTPLHRLYRYAGLLLCAACLWNWLAEKLGVIASFGGLATLLHCKLKHIVERITMFVTNLSRNKIQCCKSRQHVAQSRLEFYFLQQILVLLLILPLKLQLVLQQIWI